MSRKIVITLPEEFDGLPIGEVWPTFTEGFRKLWQAHLVVDYPIEEYTAPVPTEPPPVERPTAPAWVNSPIGLRLRREPDPTKENIIEVLPNGMEIAIYTDMDTKVGAYTWVEVVGKMGWVAKEFLSFDSTQPIPTIPPVDNRTEPLTGAMRLKSTPDGIVLDGFQGVGSNLREGMWLPSGDIEKVLRLYQMQGIKHVRMYLHKDGKQFPEVMERLRFWLNKTAEIGVQLVVVFDDSIRSGYHCDVNNIYHTESDLNHLNIDWYRSKAYLGAYADRVKEVAFVMKDYSHGVLDLCNEPANVGGDLNEANYYAFKEAWRYLSEVAYKAAQGRVPITVGIINVNHFKPATWSTQKAASDFYGGLPHISLASVHHYRQTATESPYGPYLDFEYDGYVDFKEAQRAGKACWVGEIGIHEAAPNRPAILAAYLDRMQAQPVTAISYWGYDPRTQAQGSYDQGWHDAYAIAWFRGNGDYDGMRGVLLGAGQEWANAA